MAIKCKDCKYYNTNVQKLPCCQCYSGENWESGKEIKEHYVESPIFHIEKHSLDDFAIAAMQGQLSYANIWNHDIEELAEESYKIAKAMLKEREKHV
jgi:hypothetical protein